METNYEHIEEQNVKQSTIDKIIDFSTSTPAAEMESATTTTTTPTTTVTAEEILNENNVVTIDNDNKELIILTNNANVNGKNIDTEYDDDDDVLDAVLITNVTTTALSDPDDDDQIQLLCANKNSNLKLLLDKSETNCLQLQELLQQKDNIIVIQKRELNILEQEKKAIKCEYDLARKEKEQAVVKYAIVEKNVIDCRTKNEQLTLKTGQQQKHIDSLMARLQLLTVEKDKLNQNWRECYRDFEILKADTTALETKLKWNQVKLKQEMQIKIQLEKRINELIEQINVQQNVKVHATEMIKNEEREIEAKTILLKHMYDEKDKENGQLQERLKKIQQEFIDLQKKYQNIYEENNVLRLENSKIHTNYNELNLSNTQLNDKLNIVQCELNDTLEKFNKLQIKFMEKSTDCIELMEIKENYQEQTIELKKIRENDECLMKLIQELTEKSVTNENKLILANAKQSAIILENEKIKSTIDDYKIQINELDEKLIKFKLKRNDEIKLLSLLLSEKQTECEQLKLNLDNSNGELETTKHKNLQYVKELQRDLSQLKCKLANNNNNTCFENQDQQSLQQQQQQQQKNSEPHNEVSQKQLQQQNTEFIREPTKQSLIDRIVKLQRALARQTEKIEFLENHCATLMNELQHYKS